MVSHGHGCHQGLGWDCASRYLTADRSCPGEDVASRDSGRHYTPNSPLTLPFCLSNQTNQKGVSQWFSTLATQWNHLISYLKALTPRPPRQTAAEPMGMQPGLWAISAKSQLLGRDPKLGCICINYEEAPTSAVTFLVIIIPGSKGQRENEQEMAGWFINWTSQWKESNAGNFKNNNQDYTRNSNLKWKLARSSAGFISPTQFFLLFLILLSL